MGSPRVHRLKRLLRRDSINIKKIVVAAHEKKADSVYVFFEYAEEETRKDKETLKLLKAKAEEVAKDEIYAKLANAKQRELFLLDHYGLSKRDSVDVVELVKMIEIESKISEAKIEEEGTEKEGKKKK